MEPTGETPTSTGSRSNYNFNISIVQENALAEPVMPGGAASSGTSVSDQRAVQNNRRAELYEAEARHQSSRAQNSTPSNIH